MPNPTGPTNPEMTKLIVELRRKKTPFHAKLARHLAKPARAKRGVSLFKINKAAAEGDNVFVPSKVLSSGELTKKVNVYAFAYAKNAKQKIMRSGGAAHMLSEALTTIKKGRIVV